MAISFVNYEFPSLAGGLVGCMLSGLLIHFRVGLKTPADEEDDSDDDDKDDDENEEDEIHDFKQLESSTAGNGQQETREEALDDDDKLAPFCAWVLSLKITEIISPTRCALESE